VSLSKSQVGRDPGSKRPEVANVGSNVGPKPTPRPTDVGNPYQPAEKFEQVDFAAVRGGPGNVNAGHGGHGHGHGGPQPTAQKESRGIKPAESLFMAQSGRSPKRSAGRSTKPSDIDKLKTAGS
jgi:hypothetical protein